MVGVVLMVGLVSTLLGAAYAAQRSLIYFPLGGPVPPAAQVLPGGRDVELTTEDGLRLRAWYFPAKQLDGPVVLFAPGNGGNRTLRAPLAEALLSRGMSVLLLDYRGYGGNPGSPSEEGLVRDVRAAHAFLTGEEGVRDDRLLYFGESLGCGVVSALATEHPPAGMLLRSPFVDLASVGAHHYPLLPVRMLLKDRFPVAENVRRLRGVPVTVVWGARDSIVPSEQSRRVAEAGSAERVEVAGAEHNDMELLTGTEVLKAIGRLAENVRK